MSVRERLRRFVQTKAWRREQARLWAARYFPESQREVAAKLADTIVAYTCLQFERIEPSSRFLEDLGMHDFQDIEVIMELEKEFGVTVAPEEAERVASISGLVAYLTERRA